MAYSEWGVIDHQKNVFHIKIGRWLKCQRSLFCFLFILVDALVTVKSQIQSDVFSWDELWCFWCGGDFSLSCISSDKFMLVLLAEWFIGKSTIQMKPLSGGKGRVNVILLIMLDPSAMETVFCTHFWLDRFTLDAEGNLQWEQLIAYNNKRDKKRSVASR